MKLFNKPICLSVSLAALFCAQASFADGTEAGTVVSNTATLSYSVGGAVQSDIVSDVADFKVDQKVDLTVTGDSTANIIVGPSSARAANKLTYVLSNDGNLAQDFKISVSHLASEDFDAGTTPATTGPQAAEACQFTVYEGTTATVLTGPHVLADTPSVNLAIDATARIEVSCSMPNRPDVEDGDLSTLDVLATAVDGIGNVMAESTIADREDEVDVVLADGVGTATDGTSTTGARNAKHSATQTYEINAPMLSVLKTSAVISDPFNLTSDPKRIPGAIVEYTITIQNTSDSAATGVKITDILTAAVNGEVEFVEFMSPLPGASTSNYDAGTKTVTFDGLTVPAGNLTTPGEVEVTFKVEIL